MFVSLVCVCVCLSVDICISSTLSAHAQKRIVIAYKDLYVFRFFNIKFCILLVDIEKENLECRQENEAIVVSHRERVDTALLLCFRQLLC
jgi:hypothetical protein